MFGRDHRIRMMASILASSSSDVTLSQDTSALSLHPVFLDIATITIPLSPPLTTRMPSPLSTSSTRTQPFTFVVPPLIVDVHPVLYPPVSRVISVLHRSSCRLSVIVRVPVPRSAERHSKKNMHRGCRKLNIHSDPERFKAHGLHPTVFVI